MPGKRSSQRRSIHIQKFCVRNSGKSSLIIRLSRIFAREEEVRRHFFIRETLATHEKHICGYCSLFSDPLLTSLFILVEVALGAELSGAQLAVLCLPRKRGYGVGFRLKLLQVLNLAALCLPGKRRCGGNSSLKEERVQVCVALGAFSLRCLVQLTREEEVQFNVLSLVQFKVLSLAYQGRGGAAAILPCFLILCSHLPWFLMVLSCAF